MQNQAAGIAGAGLHEVGPLACFAIVARHAVTAETPISDTSVAQEVAQAGSPPQRLHLLLWLFIVRLLRNSSS